MKNSPFFILLFFLLANTGLIAQQAEWIRQVKSTGPDRVQDITIDNDGNIYVTGNYSNGANFGNGIVLPSAGQQDFFVAKYSSNGTLIWLLPGGSVLADAISGICIDDQGFTYVTGYAGDNEGVNLIILKIDNQGSVVWQVTELIEGFGGGNNITVDANGNVYVSGNYSETIYFNDGTNSPVTFNTPDNRSNIFIAKYNSSGSFQWADQAGGFDDDYGIGIAATADGTIFMSGSFDNTAYGLQGNDDAFVTSYSSSGNINWVKQYGGSNRQMLVDIALGNDNSLYTTGTNGPVSSLFDGVVIKYNQSTGQTIWTDIIPEVELQSIFVNPDNSYFIGGLSDDGTLSDFFLAKYISNNQEVWQYRFGGASENGITGIVGDVHGHAYISGWFNGSFTEGGITYNSIGSTDGLIAHILSSNYCLSTSQSTNFAHVSNVLFNTSDNSSSNCATYTNHDFTIAEIYPSLNTFFEITLSSCGGNFTRGMKIFVDWNQDDDFTDAGEEVYVSDIVGNGVINGSFIAPNNFTTGSTTTMRIVTMNIIDGDPTQDQPSDIVPCGTYLYGETEDYKVDLIDNSPPSISGLSPEQGYLGDQVTITGNFFDPNTIDSVQINTTNTSYVVVNNNTIIASPNIGTTTGPISIYYDNDSVISSSQNYTLLCTEEFTGFEDQALPNGWLLFNQDQLTTFQIIDLGAYGNSDYSVYINNFNYEAPGQLDGFLLGNICVEGVQSLSLEFDLAYTYFLQNNIIGTDTLLLLNLDNNEIIWKSGGANLATAPPQGTSFTPTSTDWEPKVINLSNLLEPGITEVNLALLNFNGFGNNLYIDNLSVMLDAVLPVDFTSFSGEAINQQSYLDWETASEYNIAYYEVARSENGVDFYIIDTVTGRGNSEFGHRYQYIDRTPFSGNNYYKITSVEIGGKLNHSEIITVAYNIDIPTVEIHPNPSEGQVIINTHQGDVVKFSINDINGKTIYSDVILDQQNSFDFSFLPKGIYVFQFIVANKTTMKKVILQ